MRIKENVDIVEGMEFFCDNCVKFGLIEKIQEFILNFQNVFESQKIREIEELLDYRNDEIKGKTFSLRKVSDGMNEFLFNIKYN